METLAASQQADFRRMLQKCATANTELSHLRTAMETLGALGSILNKFEKTVSSLAVFFAGEAPFSMLHQ